jgi:hypothetical protein
VPDELDLIGKINKKFTYIYIYIFINEQNLKEKEKEGKGEGNLNPTSNKWSSKKEN